MEKGFCVMKLCQSQPEVERAVSSVKKLAESGSLLAQSQLHAANQTALAFSFFTANGVVKSSDEEFADFERPTVCNSQTFSRGLERLPEEVEEGWESLELLRYCRFCQITF